MIVFPCPGCPKVYRVPDASAGRRAKCKVCGAAMTVPNAPTPTPNAPPAAPAPRPPARTRRLMADAQQVRSAFAGFDAIRPEGDGDAPELWRVAYAVDGLAPGRSADAPVPRRDHVAEFRLPPDYPRLPPRVRLLTPAFHPNVDPATVCVGDHWTAAERLADLIVRVGEMIAYQAYNVRSPLDGEAAMWADLNQAKLPIDPRDLRPPALR